jgi:hypothetical protein
MSLIKEIFWEDLKEDVKFFIRNFKEIVKRIYSDLVDEFKQYK